jgi:hypothetical protein
MVSVPSTIEVFPGSPPSRPDRARIPGFLPLLLLCLIAAGGNLARAQELSPSPEIPDPDLSTYRQLVEEQRQIVDGDLPATDGPPTSTGTDRRGFAPGEASKPQSCVSYRTLAQRQDDYIRALERALAGARAGGSN